MRACGSVGVGVHWPLANGLHLLEEVVHVEQPAAQEDVVSELHYHAPIHEAFDETHQRGLLTGRQTSSALSATLRFSKIGLDEMGFHSWDLGYEVQLRVVWLTSDSAARTDGMQVK